MLAGPRREFYRVAQKVCSMLDRILINFVYNVQVEVQTFESLHLEDVQKFKNQLPRKNIFTHSRSPPISQDFIELSRQVRMKA